MEKICCLFLENFVLLSENIKRQQITDNYGKEGIRIRLLRFAA